MLVMPKEWKTGVFAGVISAFLLLLPTIGFPIAGLLSFFMPLPLFLAGLSAGTTVSAIGALTTTLISTLVTDLSFGLTILGTVGIPVMVFTSRALLNRTVLIRGQQSVEWYPAGLMLVWLSGFAALILMVLTAIAYLGQGVSLSEWTRRVAIEAHGDPEQVAAFLSQFQPPISLDQYINILTRILPAFIALNLAFMAAANAGLAQLILTRKNRAIRPSPSIKDLELPEGLAIALAGSIGLWLIPGELGIIGGSFAIILFIPYFLLGLAVVHAISTAWPGRTAFLALLYLTCVFFPGMTLLIALLGIVEQRLHLRQRFGASANSGKPPKGK